MSLFSELTSIAEQVTGEIKRLHAESDIPPGTRPYLYGASSKKLEDAVDDVKSLASDLLSKTKSFEDFEKFLNATEELLQEKTQAVDAFEAHLKNYGYVPDAGQPILVSAAAGAEKPGVTDAAPVVPFYEFLSPELSASSRREWADRNPPRDVSHQKIEGAVPRIVKSEVATSSNESSVCRSDSAVVSAPRPKFQVPTVTLTTTDDVSSTGAATYDDSQKNLEEVSGQIFAISQEVTVMSQPTVPVHHPSRYAVSQNHGLNQKSFSMHPLPPSGHDPTPCKPRGSLKKFSLVPRKPKSGLGVTSTCVGNSDLVTPKTKQNVERWLRTANLDQPFSESPFQLYTPRVHSNPYMQTCGELNTPYQTPAHTPLSHMVSCASPNLTNSTHHSIKMPLKNIKSEPITTAATHVSSTLASCLTSESGPKTGLSFPHLSSSDTENIRSKPSVISRQNSYTTDLNLSLEEPTLSDVTVKVLAELRKTRERQSALTKASDVSQVSHAPKSSEYSNKIDTPEEPVLSYTVRSIDTPEEPVLSDALAAVGINSLPPPETMNIPVPAPVSSSIPQVDLVPQAQTKTRLVRSESLQNLLNAGFEKSPELSETTRQILLSRNNISKHSSATSGDSVVPKIMTRVNNVESYKDYPRIPSKTIGKENKPDTSRSTNPKDIFLSTADVHLGRSHEPSNGTERNSNDTSDQFDDDIGNAELSYLRKSFSFSGSARPAVDNSFSQAMLQYSHVPASPMPPPLTPHTWRGRPF
ncbi:hypothetical protein FHG87_006217 [Trinorchestia longiramus]|nr:hypothetical protein FHG87_006217 [Trinorchestia longiramus]